MYRSNLCPLNIAENKAKVNSDEATVVIWPIVVTLVCGIVVGILLSYIVYYSHHRWFGWNKKSEQNPDLPPTERDSTYQELDLTKMNTEDNYQSLTGISVKVNCVANDDNSNYSELSKTRDVENNYQSLT